MNEFNQGILIISHPDDECLFASSILESISLLIICFSKVPGEREISIGREKSLRNYPLKNFKIINLDITQPEKSFLPLNWLNIKEKYSGLKGGYHEKSYDIKYENILKKLRQIIPRNGIIISHNPWGEYGHSQHCQVFKASFQVANEKNCQLYVNGYISNLTKFYAQKKIHLLEPKIYQFRTNHRIYLLLKNHYSTLRCWTWYNNYKLPDIECFYKIKLKEDNTSLSLPKKCFNVPLVFINHSNPLKYYLLGVLKNFVPKIFKNIKRNYRSFNLKK